MRFACEGVGGLMFQNRIERLVNDEATAPQVPAGFVACPVPPGNEELLRLYQKLFDEAQREELRRAHQAYSAWANQAEARLHQIADSLEIYPSGPFRDA